MTRSPADARAPSASSCSQAPCGEPYRSLMYSRPHRICVFALVFQFAPAEAILEPGTACGMPYAPDPRLRARTSQPLSRAQSGFSQWN